MKKIFVVAAIIFKGNKILCVQRGLNKYNYISKKYEFPGGKIEVGESDEDALKREILEELSMDIEIKKFIMTVNHQYPDFNLNMKAYKCSSKNNAIILSEHIDYKWLEIDELSKLDWAEADLPIIEKLKIL
jgi:8-oxo-dGTP diphosphatase